MLEDQIQIIIKQNTGVDNCVCYMKKLFEQGLQQINIQYTNETFDLFTKITQKFTQEMEQNFYTIRLDIDSEKNDKALVSVDMPECQQFDQKRNNIFLSRQKSINQIVEDIQIYLKQEQKSISYICISKSHEQKLLEALQLIQQDGPLQVTYTHDLFLINLKKKQLAKIYKIEMMSKQSDLIKQIQLLQNNEDQKFIPDQMNEFVQFIQGYFPQYNGIFQLMDRDIVLFLTPDDLIQMNVVDKVHQVIILKKIQILFAY